jgi:aerobic carbon-monoxide dehydrogenase medium subunit
MKPAPFDYSCPSTIAEAVALMAEHDGEAKAIAGGQSLMPLLAFWLAAPKLLVDLRKLPGLDRIVIGDDGVRLGAKVRWRDIEDDVSLASAHSLLRASVAHVAHYQIRNRGTVGGSLAHADPAVEMPGIAIACDAAIAVVGAAGGRLIAAADFFLGPLTTALGADEIITEIRLPAWATGRRWGFEEFARRRGDFALTGIALYYDSAEDGRVGNAHIGVIGACSRPHRLTAAEATLNGLIVEPSAITEVALAAAAEVEPPDDLRASAAYRRALVATLVERALTRASA